MSEQARTLMDLPNLDYAYLARYAEVVGGMLNAQGASFTQVDVDALPAMFPLSVAGRVRLDQNCPPVPMRIELSGPSPDTPVIATDLIIDPAGEFAYQGRVGVLFALSVHCLLLESGLHTVAITLGDKRVRELMFTVAVSGGGL